MGRLAEPSEIAESVSFIISPKGRATLQAKS